MLYTRVGSECASLAEATKLGLEGFRKLLKDAPALEVAGMGADAMAALFARCLTGQPQPAVVKKPAPNKAGAAPLKAGAATRKDKPEGAGPAPVPPEQVPSYCPTLLPTLLPHPIAPPYCPPYCPTLRPCRRGRCSCSSSSSSRCSRASPSSRPTRATAR